MIKQISKRMESWVYLIINPIIDALEVEINFLRKGDLSWRFYSMQTEYINKIVDYIDYSYIHNYNYFLKHNTDINKLFHEHDCNIESVIGTAHRIFSFLQEYKLLKNIVEESLEKYINKHGEYPGGAVPKEKFLCLIIEHLINNIESLPLHHADAIYWKENKELLKGLYENLKEKEEIENLKEILLNNSTNLIKILRDKSYKICDEYDIPADPYKVDYDEK